MITVEINEQVADSVAKGLSEFNAKFLEEFLIRVKQRTPVRTGFLQESWGGNNQPTKMEIFNGAPYAEYIENGTERIAPVGMLKTTILEGQDIANKVMEETK